MQFREKKYRNIVPVSTVVPVMRRDKMTGVLKQVDLCDWKKKVDSYRESALDRILDRFLEDMDISKLGYRSDDDLDDLAGLQAADFLVDKLDQLSYISDSMQEVVDKYDLPADWSFADVASFVTKEYDAVIAEQKRREMAAAYVAEQKRIQKEEKENEKKKNQKKSLSRPIDTSSDDESEA